MIDEFGPFNLWSVRRILVDGAHILELRIFVMRYTEKTVLIEWFIFCKDQ